MSGMPLLSPNDSVVLSYLVVRSSYRLFKTLSYLVRTLRRPWGEPPDGGGCSYLYFLVELKEIPFKVRGWVGTLHLFVGSFVLPLLSECVIGSFRLGVLQAKGCL